MPPLPLFTLPFSSLPMALSPYTPLFSFPQGPASYSLCSVGQVRNNSIPSTSTMLGWYLQANQPFTLTEHTHS